MILANLFKHLQDALWLAGGIGAAADLGLDDFGSGGYEPCPCAVHPPHCPNEEVAPCRVPCSNCLPTPLSR